MATIVSQIPPNRSATNAGHISDHDVIQTPTGILQQLAVRGPDGLNVVEGYGADPTNTTDSTTAINNALTAAGTAGGTVYIPAGTYKVSSALSIPTGVRLVGAGMNASILSMTSTTADCLTMTDKRYISVRDLQLLGPSSGTGRGIAFLHSVSALASITLRNLYIKSFGGNGIFADTLITSDLTNIRVESCGAENFYITNSTSTHLSNCYANGPTASSSAVGYRINNCRYCSLTACAADNVTDPNGAYFIQGGNGISLNGCGCENPPTGFKVSSSGTGIVFNGCRVLGCTGTGFLITSTSTNCTLNTPTEISPGVGATASISVAAGSTAVVINPNVVTAQSYAVPSAYVITSTGGVVH